MITRIIINGYRCFRTLDFAPDCNMNIIVGDNESGKSTLLEAISLTLNGRVNGRWVQEELNPYWFHQDIVKEYFASLSSDTPKPKPEILIELYLSGNNDVTQPLRGVHNSRGDDLPGVRVRIRPSVNYEVEFEAYLDSPMRPEILPVEYYDVDWLDFSDGSLTRRPKGLGASVIDSRTIRSTSGIDYHTREMLSEFIEPKERAAISVAHRSARHSITQVTLLPVNTRIAESQSALHDRKLGLQMDQSASASWESSIVPEVDSVPFAMSGQGQQAAIKVALAMNRKAAETSYVLIEEPENHLSHTSLTKLVSRIEQLAGERQLFVSTHSSFVLNRLGLDKLVLLNDGKTARFADLALDTVKYFKRLSGYDTLRLVLASSAVLVEGPSDDMVLDRAFRDTYGVSAAAKGVDIISLRGVAFSRSLQLSTVLDRKVAALRDNDGKAIKHWTDRFASGLLAGKREIFIGDPADGKTLETQLLQTNGESHLRTVLGVAAEEDLAEWMEDHKTEGALRIAESDEKISFPKYILDAVAFFE